MPAIVIEVDGQYNEALSFRPLQRRIRGRFDLSRDSEPQSKLAAGEQPGPIPGQRIGFDSDKGCGFVEESLHDDEHEVVRERIEAKGLKIGPRREEFAGVDANTWTYWLSRAVDSGIAKVVSGKFPKIDESRVRKTFIIRDEPTPTDRLTAALERQTDLMEQLLSKLTA